MGDPRWYSQGKVIAAWGMLGLAVMANAIRAGEPGNTSRDAVEGAVPGQRPGPGDSKRSTQVKVEGEAMPGAKLASRWRMPVRQAVITCGSRPRGPPWR